MRYAFIDSGFGLLKTVYNLNINPPDATCYFLTSGDFPLGNKSDKEIQKIVKTLIKRLRSLDIDKAFICCNTLSSEFKDYRDVETILEHNLKLVSDDTCFISTYSTYKRISNQNKKFSLNLARYIEELDIEKVIDDIFSLNIESERVVLGCTHFPLVSRVFENAYPRTEFVDGDDIMLSKLERGNTLDFYADARATEIIATFFPTIVLKEIKSS